MSSLNHGDCLDLRTTEGRAAARAAGLPVPPEPGERAVEGVGADPASEIAAGLSNAPPNARFVLAACKAHALPTPQPEVLFAPPRKWRFDWLFDGWLALEIEGGVWTQGRHTRGKGFLRDMEKYNEAAIMGYTVLRCTWDDVESGYAFELVKRCRGARKDRR